MVKEQVSQDEIETERTPKELITWVESKINEIDDEAIRLSTGLVKVLIEEVFPLSIFAYMKYGESNLVSIKPVVGSQSYDAILTDNSCTTSLVSYIEVTQAHEGEIEYLRHLYLNKYGYVPVTGDIKKTGTKKTGLEVSASFKAVSVIEVAEHELKKILEAIRRKEKKNYPANTCLVVEFDDGHMFRRAVDNSQIDSFMKASLVGIKLPFRDLYLVGRFKEIFRQYKLILNNGRIERVIAMN